MEERSDRFTAIEDRYAGYTVVDESGSKIGKVDDLFLDENDRPEYFGVKMGFLGTSSTLIPADIATVNSEQGSIEVSQSKSTVQDGPAFDDDREITPEYENEVRSYYGLGSVGSAEDRGTYGDYDAEHSGAGSTSGLEDELRVQRSEEELRAGVREREVVRVPKRREEVDIERVPVEGEAREASGATEADIGEEVVLQVFEEEVVVTKRVVLKEEIRLRKKVAWDEEIVEVDLRKEEVEVDDQTKYGAGGALWELPGQAPPAREED